MAYNSPSFEGSAPVLPQTDLSSVSMTAMTRPGVSIPEAYTDDYENPNPRSPIGRTIAADFINEVESNDVATVLGAHGRAEMKTTDRAAAGGW